MAVEPSSFRFGDDFELNLSAYELRTGGTPLKLKPIPMELLIFLIRRRGELVTRDQIVEKIWGKDVFLDSDNSINSAISKIRQILRDNSERPRYIQTVTGKGYRFIAQVEEIRIQVSETGAQIKPPSEAPARARHNKNQTALVLASLAIVVVGSGLWLARTIWHFRSTAAPDLRSVAVLPLDNLSGDPSQDYFADGMTEALVTDLGKISALRVISRTSVTQYKGTRKSLPEIARELNVDALIEGTVARSGSHVRITANLVQASPEKHLWAESYESEVGDVLTLQGQVAQAIAREIRVKVTPDEQKLLGSIRPLNPRAHDDYLRGRYLCSKDTRAGVDKAIQYFQQAIEEAPSEPLPYAGLADCYAVWGWGGDIFAGDVFPAEFMPKAREAALKALQLDENLAEAHTSLACVELILDHNWSYAEREFKRAIMLNPSYSPAHSWYAHFLVAMGRTNESVAEAKRSLELDPFSPFTMDFAEWAFYLGRQYDLAIEQSKKSSELAPEFPWSHYDLGQVYERTGRQSEAIEEFMKAQEIFGLSPARLSELRRVYHNTGEGGYWRKILEFCQEASKQPRKFGTISGYGHCDYMKNLDIAAVQVRLGEFNSAFESMERAYTKREAELIYLNVAPDWDRVRSDPRFAELVRRVGPP